MIQANELRLGNYILYLDELYVVDGIKYEENAPSSKWRIFFRTIDGSLRNGKLENWIEPVPLTPEILERAGGKYEKIEGSASLDYSDKDGTTEYWYYKQFGGITIVRWDNGPFILSNSFSFNLRVELKHLHHFQNVVFALCGTEIDINL
jgi:hypothetical protein